MEGTWYGGRSTLWGKTGVPVSLDREEYMELDTERSRNLCRRRIQRDIRPGDIVRHFKREWVSPETSEYLYKVLAFAQHTETGEMLAVYQGLYAPFKISARPYAMFMSEVDKKNIGYPSEISI